MKKLFLKNILSTHFLKFSLIPILVVEVTLIILYFSINKYISSKNTALLEAEVRNYSKNLLKNESESISNKLLEISRSATFLQKEHEAILQNPSNFSFPNGEPIFDVAPNGVYYKVNEVGASLFYSSNTKMTNVEKDKALYTEAMDLSLKNIVDINPLIVASYFNTWDNMNRLYPFIPKVYEQYGNHINMEDYNFYYLADKKHNPQKKAVWTGAYLDPAGNGWMLSCIVPIYKNDFLEGVTGLDITIDSFVKNILNTNFPYDAKLFMVDNEGMILAMPEKIEDLLGLKELKEHLYTDVLLKTIEKPEEYNILKNSSPFASHFQKLMKNQNVDELLINGNEYITLMENVKETDWKMMVLIDKRNVFSQIEQLNSLTNKIGYVAIVLLLLFYVIFFYLLLKKINLFSNKITKPIVDLSHQTTLMTKKDIAFKSVDTNILEISKLSHNFEFMINELKIQAQKLIEAKNIAENANKAKDEFLATVSHELKTPLNSINVISAIMQKNRSNHLDEKEIKNIQIINRCGNDLLHLINDILDFSKLNAGKLLIDYERININDMVNSLVDKFESQMAEKEINFKISVDDTLLEMYSDEKRISQIIKNLLSNALKFTPSGKKIEFFVLDLHNNVKFVVKDEGIGIAQDKLSCIFDRFIQVDSSTTRKYSGTGLGLAICKELTTLLKGEISVSSVENEGSTFEVIIPKNNDNTPILELKEDSSSKIVSKLLILNNKPLEFMNKIIDLKKVYEVKQVFNFHEFNSELNGNNYSKLIINISTLNENELKELEDKNLDNLVVIYEDNIPESLKIKCDKLFLKRDFISKDFAL